LPPPCPEREPGPVPEPILRWIGFAMLRAHERMWKGVERALEPLGIRGPHLYIMQVLDTDGPMSQVALTRRLPIDRTTMVHMIDDLEQMGLVERNKHPKDRRVNCVCLAPHGQEVLAQGYQRLHESEVEFLSCLSPEERAQLRSLLLRVAGEGSGE
jgi:MarR family transcriptional regulator, lower aerobic nicotinate degradation pathway regulator